MARELAAAESAAVYGRIGTTTQEFGTLASWLVDVLNVLTGNLDRPGGAMFPRAAAGQRNSTGAPGRGRGADARPLALARPRAAGVARRAARRRRWPRRWRRRARGRSARWSRSPATRRARRRTPRGSSAPLDGLDLYVARRHLRQRDDAPRRRDPARRRRRSQRSHYDLALYQLAVRNVANYSPPVLPPDPGVPDEWETLLRLAGVAAGQPPPERRRAVRPARRAASWSRRERRATSDGRAWTRGRAAPRARAAARPAAARRALRPHARRPRGGAARHRPRAARAAAARRAAHAERPDRARAARRSSCDVERLRAALDRARATAGSCSSAAASCARTTRGCTTSSCSSAARSAARCTCTPTTPRGSGSPTASRRACANRAGALEAPVEVTDAVMPGVVSLPHGWGHDAPGARLGVAGAHAGVNANLLADEALVDALSGNAVLNGIPVVVAPVAARRRSRRERAPDFAALGLLDGLDGPARASRAGAARAPARGRRERRRAAGGGRRGTARAAARRAGARRRRGR